jgi:hypothetical protein
MSTASLKRRLERVERAVGPLLSLAAPDPRRNRRIAQVIRRFADLTAEALPLMSREDAERVKSAIQAFAETQDGPYRRWFAHLFEGACRLPNLTPEAMKAVLLVWFSPECDNLEWVCLTCGLAWPKHRHPPIGEWKPLPGRVPLVGEPPWYELREFFPTCPHCGTPHSNGMWAHRVREQHYPWMDKDGYVWPEAGRPCS